MTQKELLNSYDETPYKSYPYAQSRPEKLASLGLLFGMTPPDIETARVLELGCAEGGNIIPHAVNYPNSSYVGVDLSKVQIDSGLAHIKALGLKNIELKHCSITDIDESFGKFDYIICHGVFSWVPEFVRKKILEVSNKNLTENGIAYISYNTLPGWNMVRTIRDMMLYHSKGFTDQSEKVSQSRALLEFVKDSLANSDSPYSKVLTQEAELLAKQGDHYLRHDHLEDDNKQYYFNEFMEEAHNNNLQYLSDASLSSMYLGNLGANIAEKLQGIQDIVRTEQYMDFITNRHFRSSLLCHANVKLNRALTNDSAKQFALSLDLVAEKPLNKIDIEAKEELKFFIQGNKERAIKTSSPWLKAILYVFIENKGNPLHFNTIIERATSKFSADHKTIIESELLNNAMTLVMKGVIDISLLEIDKIKNTVINKPALKPLASHQIQDPSSTWITSMSHEPISINALEKFIMQYMDGSRTQEQVIDCLMDEVKSGKLNLNNNDKKVEDKTLIKQELSKILSLTIDKLSTHSLLK